MIRVQISAAGRGPGHDTPGADALNSPGGWCGPLAVAYSASLDPLGRLSDPQDEFDADVTTPLTVLYTCFQQPTLDVVRTTTLNLSYPACCVDGVCMG